MEPYREYEIWEARREEAYQSLIKGKTCVDCLYCNEPGKEFENRERIGWCEDNDDFVSLDELVSERGCETFYGNQ